MAKQPIDEQKDNNGAQAAPAQFVCTETGYKGSQEVIHGFLGFMLIDNFMIRNNKYKAMLMKS